MTKVKVTRVNGSPNSTGPPPLSAFSAKAKGEAVLKETLCHDLTVWPTCVAGLAVLAGALISPVFFLVALGSGVIGVGSWVTNFFFRDEKFASRYVQKLHEKLDKYHQELLAQLQEDLRKYQKIKSLRDMAQQAIEQFSGIRFKFDKLQEIIRAKFNAGELTYGRYFGAAEQVYLSVLGNLKDVAYHLSGAEGIDMPYIERRLSDMDDHQKLTSDDEKELASYKRSQSIYQEHLDQVHKLLTCNEQALTQMDETTAALTRIKTEPGEAKLDLDTARLELEELARRAKEFSLKQ